MRLDRVGDQHFSKRFQRFQQQNNGFNQHKWRYNFRMDILFGGFLKMGVPNSWMVFFFSNPNLKWMMTGGSPMT